MRFRFALILCLAGTGAGAQAPGNVNDCTLLPDPIALKRCVDSFGPQSLRSSNVLPLPPAASEPARSEPLPKVAPRPATDARSDAWLHAAPAAPPPGRTSPDAIQLNE